MSKRARMVLAGVGLGVGAWLLLRKGQASGDQVDTADAEASGWDASGFMDVAYSGMGALMQGKMEISLSGLNHIKQLEGFKGTVYTDTAGYRTIGYGHKMQPWETMKTISEAEAAKLLAADVATAENAINTLVKVPLSQAQFDALVSFVYNVGSAAFGRSSMLKKINTGAGVKTIAAEFGRWVYAGGKLSQGLSNRRSAEASLFSSTGGYA